MLGALHGLPTAHKDVMLTAGVRTTFGSPVLRDFVPNEDSLIVERMRAAGALMVGKTNVPEFGAGSQTYNSVFGATRNPYARPGAERAGAGRLVSDRSRGPDGAYGCRCRAALERDRGTRCAFADRPRRALGRSLLVRWHATSPASALPGAATSAALGRAEVKRTALYQRMRAFMERYEFLLLPVSQVPPFDVDVPWVRAIAGVPMASYIDWMRSCSDITVTGHPAISVPAGFTPGGLPVGLQIVGRHLADRAVLELAHAFEQATQYGRRRPPHPSAVG